MLPRLLVTIALAGVLGPGCGAPAPATGQSPAASEPAVAATPAATVEPAAQVPAIAALTIALPQVSERGKGPEPEHAFRIQASADAMVFDNEAAVNALLGDQAPAARSLVRAFASELEGDVKAGLLIRGEVDRTLMRGHLIVPLFDLIADAVDRAKEQGAHLERPPQTTTALALDKGLNMGRVLDVLYTAAKGEVQDYVAMVEGPAGRRAIPFSLPRPCTPAEQDGSCWSVAAFLHKDGLYMGLTQGAGPSGCVSAPSATRRKPLRYLISALDGKCPAARASALETSGIDSVLDALAREKITLCPNIQLGAEVDTQWGSLVGVMAQLGRRSGVVFSDQPPMHRRCYEAVPINGLAAAVAAAPEGLDDEEVWGGSAMQPVPVPKSEVAEPKIELERVVASGGFSRDDVHRITKAHGGEIRYCYQATLRRSPRLSGKIGFKLTIAADGKVETIELDRDTLNDAELRTCIEKSFRRWNYLFGTAPTTATTATVAWKLAPG